MRIAFIGHGQVGGALAVHLQRLGHVVTLATRGARSAGLETLLARHPTLAAAPAAEAVAAAEVVEAFSVYGHENFGAAAGEGRAMKPVMPFCGDDGAAKATVARLLAELGWEPLDVGGAAQALHLEHMTLLWVRMVRVGGRPARTVWAVLDR